MWDESTLRFVVCLDDGICRFFICLDDRMHIQDLNKLNENAYRTCNFITT
jgi:hypothetical protein